MPIARRMSWNYLLLILIYFLMGCNFQSWIVVKSGSSSGSDEVPVISGVPDDYSATVNLSINVSASLLKAYRYKIGSESSTDCADRSGYSQAQQIDFDITANISAVPDGPLKICVIPSDALEMSTSLTAASARWIKDTICPNTPYNAGTGTIMDPFLICSARMLENLEQRPADWNKSFKITQDIDMTGSSFQGLGAELNRFTGTIDGNTKTISNLNLSETANNSCVGFIKWAGDGLSINNLNLANVTVNASGTGQPAAGALIGNGVGQITLTQVQITSGAVTSGFNVGGLIGYYVFESGKVLNISGSTNAAAINGASAGGFVGLLSGESVLTTSTNSGTVSGSGAGGGFVGYCLGSNLSSNCVADLSFLNNSGAISGAYAGGIAGYLHSSASSMAFVRKSVNTAAIAGTAFIGGIAGSVGGTTIEDSYSTGNVSAVIVAGGLVGSTNLGGDSHIRRSFASGNISGANTLCGGLLGLGWAGGSSITNSFATGSVACGNVFDRVSRTIGDPAGATVTNVHYVSTSSCTNSLGFCTNYGTGQAAASFFHVTTNAPLSSWDFATVWQSSGSAMPTLR